MADGDRRVTIIAAAMNADDAGLQRRDGFDESIRRRRVHRSQKSGGLATQASRIGEADL